MSLLLLFHGPATGEPEPEPEPEPTPGGGGGGFLSRRRPFRGSADVPEPKRDEFWWWE